MTATAARNNAPRPAALNLLIVFVSDMVVSFPCLFYPLLTMFKCRLPPHSFVARNVRSLLNDRQALFANKPVQFGASDETGEAADRYPTQLCQP